MSIESDVKQQYAKFFTRSDSSVFKLMAEYYLRKAAILKTKDIDSDEIYKLLLRNVQKRLFIGIGCELLLKSFFLLNDYCINIPVRGYAPQGNPPYSIKTVQRDKFDIGDTLTFNKLIEHLPRVTFFSNCASDDKEKMLKAFKIAKVFRNKEGHVATLWHNFDSTNYSDVENALVLFYKMAFSQVLEVQFSFEQNEKGKFIIESI
jgi:hypothetical protein